MNVEDIREYCLQKPEVEEAMPFDDTSLVFKVCGKMFVLLALDEPWMNVKCDPDKAIELREHYEGVRPGYHMNKTQWNTVAIDGSIPSELLTEWIDDSYDLVVAKLPKKIREKLSG
jgi:predicted DNA-binding protein (MmcQ/YjbR family)